MYSIMTKANTNNVKIVLSTIVEQLIHIHITGSNNINMYKVLSVSCFHNRQALNVK